MKVTQETHLLNIQFAFREAFPKLKLAFFKNAHDKKEISSIAEEMIEDYTMAQLHNDFEEKDFSFNPNETVGNLESRFETELGLHVQVLRKSGGIYIQTSVTDDWTLSKQMEMAV